MESRHRDAWAAIHTLAAAVERLHLDGKIPKRIGYQQALLAKHQAAFLLTRWFGLIESALGIESSATDWNQENTKALAQEYTERCNRKGRGGRYSNNPSDSSIYYTLQHACEIINRFCSEPSDAAFYQKVVSSSREVELQLNGTKEQIREMVERRMGDIKKKAQGLLTRWFQQIEKVIDIFSVYTEWTRQDAIEYANRYQLACFQQGRGSGQESNRIVSAPHSACYNACEQIREFASCETDDVFYARVVDRFRVVDAILARLDA